MKVLFVSNNLGNSSSGANVVSVRNLQFVKKHFGEEHVMINNIDVNHAGHLSQSGFIQRLIYVITKLFNLFLGYSSGLSKSKVQHFVAFIHGNKITHVFLDSSLMGQLAREIRGQCPDVTCISFFHNFEFSFVKNAIRAGNLSLAIRIPTIYLNEKLTTRYSHRLITLTKRDKLCIEQRFGCKVHLVLPVSLKDKMSSNTTIHASLNNTVNYLFVGSYFFANIHGLSYFVKEVLPHISGTLTVVGKGMDALVGDLKHSRLKVLGAVEDLAVYYQHADAVIAPVLLGGGMKVKVAEALMFGKPVFATKESFEGYEFAYELVGGCCNSTKEYISTLTAFERLTPEERKRFSINARRIYEEMYCDEVAWLGFKQMLQQ